MLVPIESVRIRPAPVDGRQTVVLPGGPGAPEEGRYRGGGSGPSDFRTRPILAALVDRLEEETSARNERLRGEAIRVADAVEPFPDGSVSFRAGGALVPFFDRSGELLTGVPRDAGDRPGRALAVVVEVLRQRLAEPADDSRLEDEDRRRELARVIVRIEEELDGAETGARESLAAFRRDATEAARRAGGPFQRRGPGRILEILLAAGLGTGLRRIVRPEAASGSAAAAAAAGGAALAVAGILGLEGTTLLPVDPWRGLSLAFLPAAAALGWFGAAVVGGRSAGGTGGGRAAPDPGPETSAIPVSRESDREPRAPDPAPPEPVVPRSERELPEVRPPFFRRRRHDS